MHLHAKYDKEVALLTLQISYSPHFLAETFTGKCVWDSQENMISIIYTYKPYSFLLLPGTTA
jgi:hypothetical protein